MEPYERKAWLIGGTIILIWAIAFFTFFILFTGPVVR
jgi:hypothetical protein